MFFKKSYFLIMNLLLLNSKMYGNPFLVTQLPIGKSVTLLKPATTTIPLKEKVELSATDFPQTVSFNAIWNNQQAPTQEIRLSLFEKEKNTVRFIELKPGTMFLYSFKNSTSTISIVPEAKNLKISDEEKRNLHLKIESDKPLTVGR